MVAEVARHSGKTRDAFTGEVSQLVALIATQIGRGTAAGRRQKAIAIYGMMVGALQLARAVNDKSFSDEILASGLDEALALAGEH